MNARFLKQWCVLIYALLLSCAVFARQPTVPQASATAAILAIPVSQLPAEARRTLTLIRQGGPFPYAKDGVVFGNREGILPRQPRGYYHEFTVKTPGSRNRGAQRMIVGGRPASSSEIYYTADHYASFRQVVE